MKQTIVILLISLLLSGCSAWSEAMRDVKAVDYDINKQILKCTTETATYLDEVWDKIPPTTKQDIEEAVEDAMIEHYYECSAQVHNIIRRHFPQDPELRDIVWDYYEKPLAKRERKVTAHFIKFACKEYNIK